jgi:hypothetical protein
METLTSIILLIFNSSIMDRVRGDNFGFNRTFEKIIYGWIIATLAGLGWSLWTPAVVGLFAVGSAFGWGMPFGSYLYDEQPDPAKTEWWQVGPLWKLPFTSLIVRGLLWGAPVLAIAYWVPQVWVITAAYAIAFPLSAFLIKMIFRNNPRKWEFTEYARGFLGALLTFLFCII